MGDIAGEKMILVSVVQMFEHSFHIEAISLHFRDPSERKDILCLPWTFLVIFSNTFRPITVEFALVVEGAIALTANAPVRAHVLMQ